MKRWIVAIALATATPAVAETPVDTITYRVKEGDTLGLVAAEHYGDRRKAIFIMVENKLTHARALKPGERLRIPVNREITTAPGDSFESLAGTYLGNPRRGVFLAEFNRMAPDDRLPAGTALQVPFTVTHTAAASESLGSIGAAYFGDRKHGEMLRRYNFLDKSTLDKGDTIAVPVFNVRLPASRMPPVEGDAKARRAQRAEATRKARLALPKAWQAWRAGEYARIETLLVGIELDYLDTAEAVDVGILRALGHAAEGKHELARAAFKDVRARDEALVLRTFDYSPKIIALWEQVGGRSE